MLFQEVCVSSLRCLFLCKNPAMCPAMCNSQRLSFDKSQIPCWFLVLHHGEQALSQPPILAPLQEANSHIVGMQVLHSEARQQGICRVRHHWPESEMERGSSSFSEVEGRPDWPAAGRCQHARAQANRCGRHPRKQPPLPLCPLPPPPHMGPNRSICPLI